MIAVSAGRLDIVQELLIKGADVNASNLNGQTSLHYAASKNLYDIAKQLIDADAKVNVADKYGSTPLHRACSRGNNNIVKLLLSCNGIELNGRDSYGNTPL